MKDNFRMNIILLLCIWAIGGHLWVLYDRTYQQGLEIKQLMLERKNK